MQLKRSGLPREFMLGGLGSNSGQARPEPVGEPRQAPANRFRAVQTLRIALGILLVVSASNLISCAQLEQTAFPSVVPLSDSLDPLNRPAVTTAFSDAAQQTRPADAFQTQEVRSLLDLPRGPNGGFILAPGFYSLNVRSFCLHAGTRGPSQGTGYLYAPLKGTRADAIRTILQKSAQHPEIAQQDLQRLIWSIEVFVPISALSHEQQLIAAELLSTQELFEINGGVAGLIPDSVLADALARAPPELREIYRAQATLRAKLLQASSTYEELESIAVLPASDAAMGPAVPRGTWSKHPGDFYVRYLPEGYSTTLIQVYVPPLHTDSMSSPFPARMLPVVLNENPTLSPNEYDPSADVATPADTGAQRLGQSAVPVNENCDLAACRASADEALKTCLQVRFAKAVGSQDQIDAQLTCVKIASDMRASCANTNGCSACTVGAGCPVDITPQGGCSCWCSWPDPTKQGSSCVSGPNKMSNVSQCKQYCAARSPPYPCTTPVKAWCGR